MQEQVSKRGRPKLPEELVARRTVTFLLPEEKAALVKAARAEARTISGLVRMMIREGLGARHFGPRA